MKRSIGLAHLTLLETAPPTPVTLAAAAGFDTETLRRCADTGLSVHAVEAIALGPKSVLAGQISAPGDLRAALTEALRRRRPAVLDVPMVNEPVPTPGHWNITDIYQGVFDLPDSL